MPIFRAKLCHEYHDSDLNYFGVNTSKPLSYWHKKAGSIMRTRAAGSSGAARYYMGRRCPDDACQIRHWRAIRRRIVQISKNCDRDNVDCHRRQRQALLHWAHDARKI
jgi:hypothetical protein